MNKKVEWIPRLAIIFILIFGFFLLYRSNRKYKLYTKNPPFFAMDYTRAHSLSREREVYRLIDGDYDTVWTDGDLIPGDYTFEVELGLSHSPTIEGKLERNEYKEIRIFPCNESDDHAQLVLYDFQVLLRESIDPDKEKRLPTDKVLFETSLGIYSKGSHSRIPIQLSSPNLPMSEYPNSVSIVTVKGKIQQKQGSGKACISEIILI